MIERGFIRVLTTATRTAYFVDGARERGIVAETADALEEMVSKQVGKGDAVRVIVVPVRRDQLVPMLLKGLGDVAIGNLTVTPERQELVDFSPPFVSDVREVVVTAPGEDPVPTVEDLAGRRIWVRRSSSYHESLQALNRRFASEGRDPIDVRAADENLADEGLLEMVQAGLYPATVVDSHKLDWVWAKVFPKLGISEVAVREKGEVAAAFRKDSPRLQALLAEFYQQHRVGTAFGNTVVKRYYRQSRWIHNAASSEERRKYAAVVDLFRKYSDQYEFDHLMMIAQGYQESRLEPDARSHVGAIGIMQVMPETAAGHPIRMKNVEAPEDNIHAGSQVHALRGRRVLRRTRDRRREPPPLRVRGLQRRPEPHRETAEAGPGVRRRPQRVVQERRAHRGEQGRTRAHPIRRKHLQVLPGLSAAAGDREGARQPIGRVSER